MVVPLPKTAKQNRFIVTMICHSTKWVETYPVPDHKTTTVANFIARFGIIKELLHDLGADLTAEYLQVFQVYLNFFGVK